MTNVPLGPGGEFDVIRRLLRSWGESAAGIGDDAAILQVPGGSQLLATIDTAQEGVHFRRSWFSLEEIGYRATAAALSDVAAMAALPLGLLVSITLPADLVDSAEVLAAGIAEAARAADCRIVGGDTSRGDALSLTIAALGHAASPVRRSGAQPGDRVYITGRLGGSGAALAALLAGGMPRPADRERLARPVPRLMEARWLAERGARAMIDVSDGLASDVRHIAAASGVSIEVDLGLIPVPDGVSPIAASRSGEEYELIAVLPHECDTADFESRFRLPLSVVGHVAAAGQPAVSFRLSGSRVDPGSGHDHFSH